MFDDWCLPRVFNRVVAILLCVCHSLTRELLLWRVHIAPGIFLKCRFWFSSSGVVELHLSNRIPTGADTAGSGTTRSKVRSLSALNLFLLLSLSLSLFPSSPPYSHMRTFKIYIVSASRSVVSDSLWSHNPPGSSVHEILQARILLWVAFLFSRGSSWPRDWTQVSCTAGGFFTVWATRKAQNLCKDTETGHQAYGRAPQQGQPSSTSNVL